MKDDERKQKLLDLARKRFRQSEAAERNIREEARKDLEFLAGEQWDVKTRMDRELTGRPALVINRLPVFVAQETNEARKNKPAIRISPVDSGPDKETADLVRGVVRHIEYTSDADVASITALEYAASCSLGWFRLLTDYTDERSFDQEIRFGAIPNPFSVYDDPAAKKADRSDARFRFVIEDVPKDEFEAEYGKDYDQSPFADDPDLGSEGWLTGEHVRVAEYWYVERVVRKLRMLQLADGSARPTFTDEIADPDNQLWELDEDGTPKERDVRTRKVKCAKITGAEVLEEYDWLGSEIPIIPVLGKELIVNGERRLFSLIRFQRDPQQLYNYYKTAMAEAIQLAPKAPYIGAVGQFKTKEDDWKSANRVNYAYLEYDAVAVNGELVGPPQRNIYEPPVRALSLGALQASDDMKATAGMFDASLGNRSNETSGVAIARRQAESNTANFHFQDNLARALRCAGRQIVELIPKVYDTAREVRVLGEDKKQEVVKVNQRYTDEGGKERNYDLSVGKYDVTVSTGPSYQTQRQEAFDMLTGLTQGNPQVMAIGGDIIFRNSDIPGADELAERWKKTLPPELQDESGDEPAPIPPALQAQIKQLAQQHDAMIQRVHELTEVINTKKLELESRERIAALQVKASMIETEAKLTSAESTELLRADIGRIEQQIERMFSGQAVEESAAAGEPEPAEEQLPQAA